MTILSNLALPKNPLNLKHYLGRLAAGGYLFGQRAALCVPTHRPRAFQPVHSSPNFSNHVASGHLERISVPLYVPSARQQQEGI
jgi:hypothetical protein